MKRRKGISRGNSRYSPLDELQDCNEQEQKKSGWQSRASFEDATAEMTFTETVSHTVPVPRSSPQDLPIQTSNKKAPVERTEKTTPTSEERKETESSARPKKEKVRASVSLYRIVIFGSLTVAMSLLAAALLLGSKYTRLALDKADGSDEDAPTSEMIDSPPPYEDEKVIFVKPYDDTSGILTKPELYAKCASSVVSISSKNEHASGIGSGFILSEDGYIATAYHVVEGMSELTVSLADHSSYPATLVCGDAMTDLAVLKIEKTQLPTVTFGASADLLTGETVVAIGTPASEDYAGSLCSGEVSYQSRTVKIYDETGNRLKKKMTLIQTSAPVNPGNSGCPLFNEYGQVVGVITMKLGHSYSGIGFAIPSDGALPIFQSMMRGEALSDELLSAISTPAPKLGIVGEADGNGGISGVRVLRFSEASAEMGSPLKVGDLILRIEGVEIHTTSDVYAAIREKDPGDTVSVTVLRADQQLTFDLILGK